MYLTLDEVSSIHNMLPKRSVVCILSRTSHLLSLITKAFQDTHHPLIYLDRWDEFNLKQCNDRLVVMSTSPFYLSKCIDDFFAHRKFNYVIMSDVCAQKLNEKYLQEIDYVVVDPMSVNGHRDNCEALTKLQSDDFECVLESLRAGKEYLLVDVRTRKYYYLDDFLPAQTPPPTPFARYLIVGPTACGKTTLINTMKTEQFENYMIIDGETVFSNTNDFFRWLDFYEKMNNKEAGEGSHKIVVIIEDLQITKKNRHILEELLQHKNVSVILSVQTIQHVSKNIVSQFDTVFAFKTRLRKQWSAMYGAAFSTKYPTFYEFVQKLLSLDKYKYLSSSK